MNQEQPPGTDPPHHGPVSPGCPLACLATLLSQHAYKRLAWADDPPRTIADVISLHASGELRSIRGLGPRRASEIQTALVYAGLDITTDRHRHQPPRDPA